MFLSTRPHVLSRTPLPIQATGAQAIKEVYATLHRAFPDLHITAEDLIEEGDKLVARHTVTGTHQGEYMGRPPTGKPATYNEIFILRFTNGRIAETWGVVDVLSQMKQIGVIPASFS
ncbi:ester cyclase [Actinopolymorpha alba]|uniref:ester cyclase n=1 Tax=Actinopolymorpha alba TaxID=533267 RepID=UPI0009FBE4BF|nr:ester cyclase [Actinopolymorpha alba]